MNNLELWDKVEKTNPEYTKNANVKGNKITSIAPQYQIKQATREFGSYGKTWGLKSSSFDYSLSHLGMAVFEAVFYYPDGEFPIVNSVQLFTDNAQTKIDDNFAKKVETDTLTKALSKLGFNADIFLGMFDDDRYVQDMVKEFTVIEPTKEEAATLSMYKDNEDSLRFFLFSKYLGEDKYISFYNSAPTAKMKFKEACDALEKQGLVDAQEVISDVNTLLDENDPAWREHLEGLENGEKSVLWSMFTEEQQTKMKNFKG